MAKKRLVDKEVPDNQYLSETTNEHEFVSIGVHSWFETCILRRTFLPGPSESIRQQTSRHLNSNGLSPITLVEEFQHNGFLRSV